MCYFVKKYNLEHVTTSKIIVTCYEKGYLTFDEADKIWKELLKNSKHPKCLLRTSMIRMIRCVITNAFNNIYKPKIQTIRIKRVKKF